MKGRKHPPEQIVRMLHEADRCLSEEPRSSRFAAT
jgi:hypothetical protein